MTTSLGDTQESHTSFRGKSTSLALHFAVWDDDSASLCKLLKTNAYDLETRDPKGYTPLLLAYALGRTTAAYLLLLTGAFPKARYADGWEAVQIAALSGKPDLVRLAVIGMLQDMDRVYERRVSNLIKGLSSLPDFSMTMTWEFSSWVPLVSRLLPSDTLKLYKKGSHFRMESTLLQMNGISWQRGRLSHIFRGNEGPDDIPWPDAQPGDYFVMDDENKTAACGRDAFRDPPDMNVQDWVRKLLSSKLKISDWWSRDVEFERCYQRGWLYGRTNQVQNAEIAQWRDCSVWDMKNLKVHESSHAPIMSQLPLQSWWRKQYSKEQHKTSSHTIDETPEDAMKPLHRALSKLRLGVWRSESGLSATDANQEDNSVTVDDESQAVASSVAINKDFKEHFGDALYGTVLQSDHDANNYGTPGANIVHNVKDVDQDCASSLYAWILETFGDDTLLETPAPKAVPAEDFNEALKLEKEIASREHPSNRISILKKENVTQEDKNMDLKVYMSKSFPMSSDQMLPIAEALCRSGRHFKNFQRFFEAKLPAGAGFPVQFTIPVFPTVSARITFETCHLESPSASLFKVPDNYEMGAYVERSFIRQL